MYHRLKYTLFLEVVRSILDDKTTTNKMFLFKDIKTFNIKHIERIDYTQTNTH